MFRRGVVIGAVLLLATAVAYQARASGGQATAVRSAGAAAALTNLRVCGTNRVPFKGRSCTRDMRRTGLNFKEIDCSVRATVSKPTRFSATILYEGQIQYIGHEVLRRGKHDELVGVRVRPTRLPGGTYSCVFRLGSVRKRIRFEAKGPSGQFLGASVCVTPKKRGRVCSGDAAGSPIRSPRSLMCGGVFVGYAGKSWGVKLVRQTKTSPAVVGQYGARHLPGPIAEQWVGFNSRTKARVYRPATYTCLFYANGKKIAEHSFTVKA